MTSARPRVLIVCSREVRDLSLLAQDLERLGGGGGLGVVGTGGWSCIWGE